MWSYIVIHYEHTNEYDPSAAFEAAQVPDNKSE
jgi:hypothetical protein